MIRTWNSVNIHERQLYIQHLRSILQLLFLSRNFQKSRMHDKFIIKLNSMRYRKTICYLKSKNLQHINELIKKIDKKTQKLHDKRMKRWQQNLKNNSNLKILQSQFQIFNWFIKVRLSQMMSSFFAFYNYHIYFYNYELTEAEIKKKKWIRLNSRNKVYDLQTTDSFYERKIETLINTINNSKMIALKNILNKNENEKIFIICMSSINALIIYWIYFLCDLYYLTTRMLTIFLMICQSSQYQKNDYNYKQHEFETNNVYRAYIQWRISVHEKTFKCNFISNDRNYNSQTQYENQFAIWMSNTYSIQSRIKEKNEKQTIERVYRIKQRKLIKSYVLYTNKTIKNRIHILQKNREIVLMKMMYDKSKLKENENLLFNKKDHEKKAKEYI